MTTNLDSHTATHHPSVPVVVIVGGHGGLSARYRQVVEAKGWQLRHYETKIPAGARRNLGRIALVVVVATMVSHALRQQVFDAIGRNVHVVYVSSPSVSALRSVLPELPKAA